MNISEKIKFKDRKKPNIGDLVGLFNQPKYMLAIAIDNKNVVEIFNFDNGFNKSKIEIIKTNTKWHLDASFCSNPLSLRGLDYEAYVINIDEIRTQYDVTEYLETLQSNLALMKRLEIGDIVAMKGFKILKNFAMYEHHALFVDSKKFKIIHKWGEPEGTEFLLAISGVNGMAEIREDNLLEVAMFRNVTKENTYDDELKSRIPSQEEIVKRARNRLGEKTYGLLSDNCQHFCTMCRYGEARSIGVRDAVTKLTIGGAIFATCAALYSVYKSYNNNDNNKNEEKDKKFTKKN